MPSMISLVFQGLLVIHRPQWKQHVSPLLHHLHPLSPSKVVNGAYLTPRYRYSDFSMAKRSLTEEENLQALFMSSDEEKPSTVTFESDALSALPLLMPGPSFCVQSAINLHVTRMATTSVTSAIARRKFHE
ncbi:uncharacterized protein LOC143019879 [Oratosquilla oratoria]|uniref:uncharacterized protein LOC143019879 n=1 Tax=Oratosquilla oratoria TaxID=337810 RepID=UPI003F773EF9